MFLALGLNQVPQQAMAYPRYIRLRSYAALIGLLLLPTLSTAQSVQQYLAEARQAKAYFDYSGALKSYNKAAKAEPENMTVLLERGNLQLLIEKYKGALSDFEAMLIIDSMNVDAWIGLADHHRFKNELDTAMKNAELAQILAHTPEGLARAKIALAEIYMAQEERSKALKYFLTSLEIDSTNVVALKKTAALLNSEKRYDEANSYLLKAYIYDRLDLEILINLAFTFNKLEFHLEALEYSNLALELDPQHPVTLSNRAYAYLGNGSTAQALQDIKRSLANDGTNPMAYRYEGEIYLKMKDKNKACKSLEKAEKYGYSNAYDDTIVSSLLQQHCEN
jgi:tetratricopeptide (TPR) repeat protein